MAKNGIKFSRPGTPVDKVADYDSYFYTGWPWPKIIAEGDVFVNSSKARVKNPLGQPAFFMVFGQSTSLRELDGTINSNMLTIGTQSGSYPNELVHYMIFSIPLKSNIQTENINIIGQTAASRSKYGVQFNPSGLNAGTDKDFFLNSDFRSPLIHRTFSGQAAPLTMWTGVGIEYTFDLPYQPALFGFASADGENFTQVTTTAQSPPKIIFPGVGPWAGGGFRAGGVVITAPNTNYFNSMVILKNPFSVGASVDVTI